MGKYLKSCTRFLHDIYTNFKNIPTAKFPKELLTPYIEIHKTAEFNYKYLVGGGA